MESKYSDIYHRVGRISSSNENDWFENDINHIENLKLDIIEKSNITSLIQFLIEVLKFDTIGPIFLKALGSYKEIDEFNFTSKDSYNSLIKSFRANCFNQAVNQLRNIEIEFNESFSLEMEKYHLSDSNELNIDIDSDISLKVSFIEDSNKMFTSLKASYSIPYLGI